MKVFLIFLTSNYLSWFHKGRKTSFKISFLEGLLKMFDNSSGRSVNIFENIYYQTD